MTTLQKELLRVYAAFKEICDKNGLRYFAYAGTAIGAVRHNGFIPWDDDIDLTMPYPDYLRFIQIMNSSHIHGIELYNGLEKPVSDMAFLRLYSSDTMFTNFGLISEPDSFTGVYIDIIPLVGLPEDTRKRIQFVEKLHTNLYDLWFNKLFGTDQRKIKSLVQEHNKFVTAYDFDTASYVCGVDRMELDNRRTVYPAEEFSSAIVTEFENTTINLPKGYHEQLTNKFGDYMQLPPKAERVSHHSSFALLDLKTSYNEYQKIFSSALAKTYLKHITDYIKQLQQEKFDLLGRIPTLEERIKVELERVQYEVSEKERLQNPNIKTAAKLLFKSLVSKLGR